MLKQLVRLARNTNRSIATARFAKDAFGQDTFLPENSRLLEAWGARFVADGEPPDFTADDLAAYEHEPPAKRPGRERIEYARAHMPCLAALAARYEKGGETYLNGVHIAADFIIEPKTAVFMTLLARLGAHVSLYCGASSSDPAVIRALKDEGLTVYADAGNTTEKDHAAALAALDDSRPQIIIDDGAGLTRLLYAERPELAGGLIGICEETTSGVRALECMERDGILSVPAIAVNDAAVKTQFDNAHGTGETVLAVTLSLLAGMGMDTDVWEGKNAVVIGYGPVGAGIARRASGLGAAVVVCEADPVAALRALHDGHNVMPALVAVRSADFVFSATGVRNTVTETMLREAKDGAVFCSAGGAWQEIAQANLPGKNITILSGGHGVNYTDGDGNPIEIMDMAFAAQFEALRYLLENSGSLAAGVHGLQQDAVRNIAAVRLAAMNVAIDDATQRTEDWAHTRFSE